MKFLSWKGISIYLTIILFLVIFISILDWNKGSDKVPYYAEELRKAYGELLDFQTYILNDEVQLDEEKYILEMYDKNFQYQLSMFIDIFGNKKMDDMSLSDAYVEINEALVDFAKAEDAGTRLHAHEELQEIKRTFFALLTDLQ